MAGANSSDHFNRPCFRCVVSSKRTVPGHADRFAADDGAVKRNRLAVLHESVRFRGCGRRLAAVIRDQLFRLGVVQQHERAAAQAGRLGFGEAQHKLHGDGRVNCRTTALQDAIARFDRERIGRSDHPMLRGNGRLVGPAGRPLRRLVLGSGERAQERYENEDKMPPHGSPLICRTRHCSTRVQPTN